MLAAAGGGGEMTEKTSIANLLAAARSQSAAGDFASTERLLREAVALEPGNWLPLCHLGELALQLQQPDHAAHLFGTAARLAPDKDVIWGDLAGALFSAGRLPEGESAARRAIGLNNYNAGAWFNLALILQKSWRLTEAREAWLHQLRLAPNSSNSLLNLAILESDCGNLPAADRYIKEALAIDPQNEMAAKLHLFLRKYAEPYNPADVKAAALTLGALFRPTYPVQPYTHHDSFARLKIGLVSADFHSHAAARFLEPLLRHLDRSLFEVFAYATRDYADATTSRLMPLADFWRRIRALDDHQAAALIREDRIDILIDASQHLSGQRIRVFTHRPALVQITWLGEGHTTGLDIFDWFVGSESWTPAITDMSFTEKIWRLPGVPFSFEAPEAPDVGPLPSGKSGLVSFGYLGRLTRINDLVVQTYARILQAIPGSTLTFDNFPLQDAGVCQGLREKFSAYGIDGNRILTGFKSPPWDSYATLDIALDPFPHNQGTTTFEALWMGVPVITLNGPPPVGRYGAMILERVSGGGWIANDPDEYVQLAVKAAQDTDGLRERRRNLRENLRQSQFMDGPRFGREFGQALVQMYKIAAAR